MYKYIVYYYYYYVHVLHVLTMYSYMYITCIFMYMHIMCLSLLPHECVITSVLDIFYFSVLRLCLRHYIWSLRCRHVYCTCVDDNLVIVTNYHWKYCCCGFIVDLWIGKFLIGSSNLFTKSLVYVAKHYKIQCHINASVMVLWVRRSVLSHTRYLNDFKRLT